MTPSIKVDSFDDIHLRIITLGYPEEGESIMISLMDKERILYNAFTDNFDVDGFQYWVDKLPEDTRIDDFIWTHPDEDHSLGIEKLLQRFDPDCKANIYIPTSLTEQLLKDNNKHKSLPAYKYLKNNYNINRKYQWNEISLCEGEGIRYLSKLKLTDRTTDYTITFKIGFMLPYGSVVNRRVDKTKMNSGEMNDLSLFFIIELNKVRYIFSGDLAKTNIKFLDDDYLSACRFIKIPHHGSLDPKKLVEKIEWLPSIPTHAVTTVFGKTHPYDEVLNLYANKCHEVFCTGRGVHSYGMVKLDYSVKDLSKYTFALEGNAVKVRP
ncbi:MAG: hypothetical protein K2M72_03330 [Paramuribaculum sp.]|nr:hypothetical protein [Paramuribaculum sp.]